MEANFENCPMFVMLGEQDRPPYEPLHSAYDVRKCLYRSVLAGGAGFAYGCEPVRQLYRKGDPIHVYGHTNYDMPEWSESLDAPGARQLGLLPEVLTGRSYFTRVPAQELLLPRKRFIGVAGDREVPDNRHPAAHIRVGKCSEGSYIMAYCPVRQLVQLDTSGMEAKRLNVSIYDPEAAELTCQYEYANTGECTVVPKRDLDTLIVIDGIE